MSRADRAGCAGSWCPASGGRPRTAGDQVRVATAAEARGRRRDPSGGRAGPMLQAADPAAAFRGAARGGAVRRLLILLALVLPTAVARGAGPAGLAAAAERARGAWFAHDAGGARRGQPSAPGAAAGCRPVRRRWARPRPRRCWPTSSPPTQEVETTVRAAREVEPGRGYVELQRRYRVAGTQDVRTQSLLLGYRLARTGWSLVELRVVS